MGVEWPDCRSEAVLPPCLVFLHLWSLPNPRDIRFSIRSGNDSCLWGVFSTTSDEKNDHGI